MVNDIDADISLIGNYDRIKLINDWIANGSE